MSTLYKFFGSVPTVFTPCKFYSTIECLTQLYFLYSIINSKNSDANLEKRNGCLFEDLRIGKAISHNNKENQNNLDNDKEMVPPPHNYQLLFPMSITNILIILATLRIFGSDIRLVSNFK